MRSSLLLLSLLVSSCGMDLNVKQKTPIVMEHDVSGAITITLAIDIASQIERICKDPASYVECSNSIIELFDKLTELAKLIDTTKGVGDTK